MCKSMTGREGRKRHTKPGRTRWTTPNGKNRGKIEPVFVCTIITNLIYGVKRLVFRLDEKLTEKNTNGTGEGTEK